MVEQRDAAWIAKASPEDITNALQAGELVTYMGGRTDAEIQHEATVKGTPDRLYAEAHGFSSYKQMENAGSAYGSTLFTAIRRSMSHEQLEKLSWLESASPEEAYAAEQRGELDLLLRRGKRNQADGINRSVTDTVSRSNLGGVEVSALYQEAGQ